jgi:hypothetical protein
MNLLAVAAAEEHKRAQKSTKDAPTDLHLVIRRVHFVFGGQIEPQLAHLKRSTLPTTPLVKRQKLNLKRQTFHPATTPCIHTTPTCWCKAWLDTHTNAHARTLAVNLSE